MTRAVHFTSVIVMVGQHEEGSPIEMPWIHIGITQEPIESELCPENQENLHWRTLAIEDPLFQVSSTQVFGTSLFVFDITQKPPTREGVRNWDFEIVHPIYEALNEIIEKTKPAKATRLKIKTCSREHWEAAYTCEFSLEQWSYNKVDEITEGLADQLTATQDLNGGLLIQVSFQE